MSNFCQFPHLHLDKTQMRDCLPKNINELKVITKFLHLEAEILLLLFIKKKKKRIPQVLLQEGYIKAGEEASGRSLGNFGMGKVTYKPQTSSRVTEQPTPSTSGRKEKTPFQLGSRDSDMVAKTIMKAKRYPQGSLREDTSSRVPIPLINSKKTKGSILFSHYHKLNEKLNQNEPKQSQESVEKPTTSDEEPGSQNFRVEPEASNICEISKV
ncbi:uncharacterized protein LOC119863948 isoform X1 [Canis lupus familiaris]|uniref:vacuolar ATPase assembly integral membrane protein VMA21 isoform X1 n=1 Tax=Canis lupus familiaris TaxID=9615 RepID=UPI0018F6148B|nr:vacuolar ATPase assembly integral membrane protein VMA21 isoform X1 [Canis lupus familiaris]XP_038320340.1 uncharacterized protein LOC119863948 isoform X1 [Canis lupus familiaris]XP_038444490.1 uncharacterized protein LOC119878093 isoform X1 [Canis lupus familiaris]